MAPKKRTTNTRKKTPTKRPRRAKGTKIVMGADRALLGAMISSSESTEELARAVVKLAHALERIGGLFGLALLGDESQASDSEPDGATGASPDTGDAP